MVHTFQNLVAGFSAPRAALTAALEADALSMLTWVPKHGLDPINRGEHDADLRGYAAAIRDLGYPILLRPAQEMNLPAM